MTMHSAQPNSFPFDDPDLLSAYLDNELAVAERVALEKRLQAETELCSELEELRTTVSLLKHLDPVVPPRSFTLDPAQVSVRKPLFTGWLRFGSAATTLLLAVMLVTVVSLDDRPQSEEQAFVAFMEDTEVGDTTDEADGNSFSPAPEPFPAADQPEDSSLTEAAESQTEPQADSLSLESEPPMADQLESSRLTSVSQVEEEYSAGSPAQGTGPPSSTFEPESNTTIRGAASEAPPNRPYAAEYGDTGIDEAAEESLSVLGHGADQTATRVRFTASALPQTTHVLQSQSVNAPDEPFGAGVSTPYSHGPRQVVVEETPSPLNTHSAAVQTVPDDQVRSLYTETFSSRRIALFGVVIMAAVLALTLGFWLLGRRWFT